MSAPHPNISIVDGSLTKEDIARFYSSVHADVWEIVRKANAAASLRPPVFEVISLTASAAGYDLQSRGCNEIERGWLAECAEEVASLLQELPEDPSQLEALARPGTSIGNYEAKQVVQPAASVALTPANLIRVMKDQRIGRPSTYASHVESMFECAAAGLLVIEETGGFGMSPAGRALLEELSAADLPRPDKDYCAELEADLEAIERGEDDAWDVVARHLSRLPGIEIRGPIRQRPGAARRDVQDELGAHGPITEATAGFVLPPEIDPNVVLPSNHELRAVRAAFDEALRQRHGHAEPNREEASRRRACRAFALARLCQRPREEVLERLYRDLALRWVVDLAATDPVWSLPVFDRLVSDGEDSVEQLCAAAACRLGPQKRLEL